MIKINKNLIPVVLGALLGSRVTLVETSLDSTDIRKYKYGKLCKKEKEDIFFLDKTQFPWEIALSFFECSDVKSINVSNDWFDVIIELR